MNKASDQQKSGAQIKEKTVQQSLLNGPLKL